MATYWENSCSFGLRYVSWYKYLTVNLVFSHLGFWSGNLFLIAPFPDLCLLVPFPYIDEILNGDADVLFTANTMITKLRKFEIELKDRMKKEESLMMQTKHDESKSDMQKLIEMQLEFQNDFLKSSKPGRLPVQSSVKLPKLELCSFNRD